MSEKQLWRASIAEGIEIRADAQHLHAAQDSVAVYGAELQTTIADQLVLRECCEMNTSCTCDRCSSSSASWERSSRRAKELTRHDLTAWEKKARK